MLFFWAREKVNVNLPSTGRLRRGGSSLEIQTDAFHLPSQPPPSPGSYRSLCWLENGRGYGATCPFITLYSSDSNKVEGVRWKDNIREIRIQHSIRLCINILFSCNYSQCLFCFPAVSNIFLCVLNIFHVIIVNSWQPLLACVTSSNIIGQSRNMS